MSNRATRRALLRAVGLALLAPGRVLAQVTYPNRPVRILVPFAPGGGADIVSRLLSPQLQRSLGQSFFVGMHHVKCEHFPLPMPKQP